MRSLAAVRSRLRNSTVLCCPDWICRHCWSVTANAAYRAFARKHGIAHEAVNLHAGVRVRRLGNIAIDVQNVNAYPERFKAWLQGFRGVASRYLPNYLGWRWTLDGQRVI
jgi:hypothetical protein